MWADNSKFWLVCCFAPLGTGAVMGWLEQDNSIIANMAFMAFGISRVLRALERGRS